MFKLHPPAPAELCGLGSSWLRRPCIRAAAIRWILGRSLRELLGVVETLKTLGIALLSLEEKIDTSSAAGELVFRVFGAIAQFERRLIAERTRDGMNVARAKERTPGRPPLDQDKLDAAMLLMKGGMPPTKAARQIGLGRSILYRRFKRTPNADWEFSPCLTTPCNYRLIGLTTRYGPRDGRRSALRARRKSRAAPVGNLLRRTGWGFGCRLHFAAHYIACGREKYYAKKDYM